jgi:hypothetical protein
MAFIISLVEVNLYNLSNNPAKVEVFSKTMDFTPSVRNSGIINIVQEISRKAC